MEIALAIFSWTLTILGGILILSVPTSFVIEKVKKDWKGSKAEKIYKYVQYGLLGVVLLSLMITIVLMTGTF